MGVTRRSFLESTAAIAGCKILATPGHEVGQETIHDVSRNQPSFAVTPVIGDGKWIWNKPPENGETGYLEKRDFDVTVGIYIEGRGRATELRASTVAPVSFPEQAVSEFGIETTGCEASLLPVSDSAAQLLLYAPGIELGQQISAVAKYRLKVAKDYRGFTQEQFPFDQQPHKNAAVPAFDKSYFRSSPGINIHNRFVKDILNQLSFGEPHPWELAQRFHKWVWDNIEGIPGKYTSVEEAIKNKKGDCEERATVFIALCRAAGIPSRLVWVPSHNWAEIGMFDEQGNQHWIPVHTAAYSWFGWTGAHEIILQKGDHIHLAGRRRSMRLIDDWYKAKGTRPIVHFTCTITPVAAGRTEPGPGGREKLPDGSWRLTGNHPAKSLMRDK